MRPIRFLTMLIAMFPLLGGQAMAQSSDFNPSDPPEPNDVYKHKHNITVTATPEGYAYTSGTGRYTEGTKVTISTSSAVANWKFVRWLCNGEVDSAHTSASFTYTLGTADVAFTAVYEYVEPPEPPVVEPPVIPDFDPSNPSEPNHAEDRPTEPDVPEPPVVIPKYSLNIVAEPMAACSFNLSSGNKYTAGTRVALNTTGNQGFVFDGWFDAEGNLLSDTLSWVYTMPEADTTVTARWTFDPDSPIDPSGSQTNVDNTIVGDVNNDRSVTIVDVMMAISHTLGGNPAGFNLKAADMNQDGCVTIADIMMLINAVSSH